MDFVGGGVVYRVSTSGEISGFDPSRDRLDFGDTSVHGLILGKLVDGSAVVVNPWQDNSYQRITDPSGNPVRWDQLSIENFAPVGNEHLRADAGGVISWELNVGPRNDAVAADSQGRIVFTEPGNAVSETVYIRSHEYGVQEIVSNFDPETDKISFIYLGTRERVSSVDTDQGLLISVEPSGQSVLLEGVRSTELRADNVEFHFDQVREDNLEAVLGFNQNDVALVDRTVLLTPAAPAGAITDGFQVESGNPVYSTGAQLASGEPADHSMHSHQEHEEGEHSSDDHAGNDYSGGHNHAYPAGNLHLQASGSLYWGGMSGTLTITNTSESAIDNWSVSFETPRSNFQSWAGAAQVEALDGGGYRVTLTPAAWNSTIGAGESIDVSFNAVSAGLANSGPLTSALFFTDSAGESSGSESDSDPTPEAGAQTPQDDSVTEGGTGDEAPVSDASARVFEVDVYSGEVTDFRPGIDRLDFGGQSVHNLILGKTEEGYVTFLSPWNDAQKMTLVGVTYDQLALEDYGVVGNEHLRQDLGGVVSWELGVGEKDANTTYIRSHEYGKVETITDFDPATDKISFLYYGTRELLSVEQVGADLVIATEPTGQTFIFKNTNLSDIPGASLEFHFDQIVEDNLEIPFGLEVESLTLKDRTATALAF